jgi:hypothetical protein
LKSRVLWSPSCARRLRRRLSGICSPTTHSNQADSVNPGLPRPDTVRPQGFTHLLAGLLPAWPDDGPSANAASMGFTLQGLAPPEQRCPSRNSRLSCRFSRQQADEPRLQRISLNGKGSDVPPPEGGGGRALPSWVLASPRLSPPLPWDRLPGPSPSYPSGRKCSLRFHFRAGFQGIMRVVEAAGLSQGCRPS